MFTMIGSLFGPKYGHAVIKESSEPIYFNGKDAISLDITGEGLVFPDPSKKVKDGQRDAGDPDNVVKTIALTGSEGSGVGPSKYKETSHEGDGITYTLHGTIDAEFPVGYEGPLFAQVTGPGRESDKVQVGILMPKIDYGDAIIKESLEPICFNGKDGARKDLDITGDAITFYDPKKKDVFGHPENATKTFSLTGSEGSGVGPFEYETHGYCGYGNTFTISGFIDPKFPVGYEGPLFAQVTGPGPASSKVQVAIVMTQKDLSAAIAKKDRDKLISDLTEQFNPMFPKKDGFLTHAGMEELMGGPEKVVEMTAMFAEMKRKYEAGDPNIHLIGGPAGLKIMEAILALKGEDRVSLADLLRLADLA